MGCCYSNPEANAYVMDCTSRATVGISNIFLGYAILRYAAKEVRSRFARGTMFYRRRHLLFPL